MDGFSAVSDRSILTVQGKSNGWCAKCKPHGNHLFWYTYVGEISLVKRTSTQSVPGNLCRNVGCIPFRR